MIGMIEILPPPTILHDVNIASKRHVRLIKITYEIKKASAEESDAEISTYVHW